MMCLLYTFARGRYTKSMKKGKKASMTYYEKIVKTYGRDFGTSDLKKVTDNLKKIGYPSLAKFLNNE